MNWPGMLLGFGGALAVVAAAFAMFAREARLALIAAAACALGAAAMCFALGSVFVALALVLLLGLAVPVAALTAVRLAPPASPDLRPGAARLWSAAAVVVVGFAGLAWLLTTTAWPPATGPRDAEASWLGWRLLTDHILLPVAFGVLLGAAGLVASAALGPRARAGGAPAGEGS